MGVHSVLFQPSVKGHVVEGGRWNSLYLSLLRLKKKNSHQERDLGTLSVSLLAKMKYSDLPKIRCCLLLTHAPKQSYVCPGNSGSERVTSVALLNTPFRKAPWKEWRGKVSSFPFSLTLPSLGNLSSRQAAFLSLTGARIRRCRPGDGFSFACWDSQKLSANALSEPRKIKENKIK